MAAKKRRSAFMKTVLVIVLTVVPLYIFFGYSMVNDYLLIRNEIVNAKNLSAEYYTDKVFAALEQTLNQSYRLLESNLLKSYQSGDADTREYTQRLNLVRSIQEQMLNVCLFNDFVKDMKIWTENVVITQTGVIREPNENLNALLTRLKTNRNNVFYDESEDKLYLTAAVPVFSDSQTVRAIAFLELATSKIQKFVYEMCSMETDAGRVEVFTYDRVAVTATADSRTRSRVNTEKSGFVPLKKMRDAAGEYWFSQNDSEVLGLRIVLLLDRPPAAYPVKRQTIFLIILTILTAVILCVDHVLIRKIVAEPIHTLISALESAETDFVEEIALSDRNDDFGYIFERVNGLTEKLRRSIAAVYEQRIRAREAEFKHLQAQINPHFLYNCLYTISRLAKDGNLALIERFSEHLGRYFRYITKTESDSVPLREELEHVRNYIDIMCLRFGHRISVEIENHYEKELRLPKLILQPLVENAFEHGMKNVLTDGRIRITLVPLPDGLCVTVEDNGFSEDFGLIERLNETIRHPEAPDTMTALYNVHCRLKFFFGESSGLHFSESDLGGLKVEMTIRPGK